VYVIVVVPAVREVTKPVLSIVATARFEEVQGVVGSGVPDAESCKV
jgi:methyl coenzyme M reductase subunit C